MFEKRSDVSCHLTPPLLRQAPPASPHHPHEVCCFAAASLASCARKVLYSIRSLSCDHEAQPPRSCNSVQQSHLDTVDCQQYLAVSTRQGTYLATNPRRRLTQQSPIDKSALRLQLYHFNRNTEYQSPRGFIRVPRVVLNRYAGVRFTSCATIIDVGQP